MKQYSKRMVITHWLTLLLVFVAWYLGDGVAKDRHAEGATLVEYFSHALIGISVLFLTIMRLTFRNVDGTPPLVTQALADWLAKGVHHLLYGLLLIMPVVGFMTFLTSSVGLALLAGDTILLPKEYTGAAIIPRATHEILMYVLMAAVAVHIAGVIKHQFIMKDGIMGRMSLRRKK